MQIAGVTPFWQMHVRDKFTEILLDLTILTTKAALTVYDLPEWLKLKKWDAYTDNKIALSTCGNDTLWDRQ